MSALSKVRDERRLGRLDQPRELRRPLMPRLYYDPEAFGQFSERIARFLGTARFLVYMTVFVAVWLIWNVLAPMAWRFDPYPFIFLTLMLSLQASYAAPLILLAQNRQDDRDRAQAQDDRDVNSRTQADTEYLARELSSVRLTLADVVTADDLRSAVDRVGQALEDLNRRLDDLLPDPPAEPRPDDGTAP